MWFVIPITVMLLSNNVMAFSNFGHEVICQVAYELSEPQTQRFIDNIIKDDDKVKVVSFASYKQRKYIGDFAKGCTWPDVVRKTTHRETDQYHYMNVPKGAVFDHQRDCTENNCVTQAIQRYGMDLNDKTVNATNRKEALFFVGHFIADLHQPLHVGNTEDKGGNTIRVFAKQTDKKLTSLHWIWDKHVPDYAGLNKANTISTLVEQLRVLDKKSWQTTTPIDWAKESHQLAKQYVYALPDGKELMSEQVITDAYYQRAKPIIKQRFKQAAVRLANLLDLAAKGELTMAFFR